eukprot:9538132-Heterocapsa_arctica.AAC.1
MAPKALVCREPRAPDAKAWRLHATANPEVSRGPKRGGDRGACQSCSLSETSRILCHSSISPDATQ